MDVGNKGVMAAVIGAVVLLVVVAGVVGFKALSPPKLEYPSGRGGGAGGPSAAAGAPSRGPQGGGMRPPGAAYGPASYGRGPGGGGGPGYGPGGR